LSPNTIFIIGMHRSGTSCLTGSLQLAGLYLGEVFTKNPFNKKGNRESARVMDLNTALLQYNDGDWDNPPDTLDWNDEHRKERDAIVEQLKQSNQSPWGFKDPRTTFTLPFWKEVIPTPQLVASFRHPASVAASLSARNGFSDDFSFNLWSKYNRRLLAYLEQEAFPIVCFDMPSERYLNDIAHICRILELKPDSSEGPFFEADLRSQSASGSVDIELPDETTEIYAGLMSHYNSQRFM